MCTKATSFASSEGELWRNGELLGRGTVLDRRRASKPRWRTRARPSAPSWSASPRTRSSTSSKEARLTFEPFDAPAAPHHFAGRHALVVVRGHDYRSDLAALRSYIREYRPVLIGVDGGADALLEHGLKPDIIIGDFDSVSEKGLRCGAELVHHVHPDGRAPGAREPPRVGRRLLRVRGRGHQ